MKIRLSADGSTVEELNGCRNGQPALVHRADSLVAAFAFVKQKYLPDLPDYSLSLGAVMTETNIMTGSIVIDISAAREAERMYVGVDKAETAQDANDAVMDWEVSDSLKMTSRPELYKTAMKWWNERLTPQNRRYLSRTANLHSVGDIAEYYSQRTGSTIRTMSQGPAQDKVTPVRSPATEEVMIADSLKLDNNQPNLVRRAMHWWNEHLDAMSRQYLRVTANIVYPTDIVEYYRKRKEVPNER